MTECGTNTSAPTDPPHTPGCPALRTPDHSKLAERNAAGLARIVDRAYAGGIVAIVPPGRSFDLPSEVRGAASPPLYLSFCTLLI